MCRALAPVLVGKMGVMRMMEEVLRVKILSYENVAVNVTRH